MTLVEVLIAMALAMVGLFGSLAIVTSVMRGGAFSRDATEASVLAQSRLEEMVVNSGLTLTLPPDGTFSVEAGLDGLGVATPTGLYTRRTVLATTPDNLRRIVTVTVSWADATNGTHSITASRQKAP